MNPWERDLWWMCAAVVATAVVLHASSAQAAEAVGAVIRGSHQGRSPKTPPAAPTPAPGPASNTSVPPGTLSSSMNREVISPPEVGRVVRRYLAPIRSTWVCRDVDGQLVFADQACGELDQVNVYPPMPRVHVVHPPKAYERHAMESDLTRRASVDPPGSENLTSKPVAR
jgi:hypothetical protein